MAKILTVDDEEEIRNSMLRMITVFGHAAHMASNGQMALYALCEAVSVEPFDLVITDLNMPVMDGLSLVREIRKSKSDVIKKLPVILVTGGDIKRAMRVGALAGANKIITKPFGMDDLESAINELIRC